MAAFIVTVRETVTQPVQLGVAATLFRDIISGRGWLVLTAGGERACEAAEIDALSCVAAQTDRYALGGSGGPR